MAFRALSFGVHFCLMSAICSLNETIVVCDSQDLYLIGTRNGGVVKNDRCGVVMVVFPIVVCYESGCGFLWSYSESVGSEPRL